MSAVPQLEPGHPPPAAPPPPPPRGQSRHQPKPPAAFRVTSAGRSPGTLGPLRLAAVSSPAGGRTWQLGAPAPGPGLTLSDAGGLGERAHCRRSAVPTGGLPVEATPHRSGTSAYLCRPASPLPLRGFVILGKRDPSSRWSSFPARYPSIALCPPPPATWRSQHVSRWLTVVPNAKPRPESRGSRVEITDRVAIAGGSPRWRTPAASPRPDGGSGKYP
jgi:hypothetical protein